MWTYILEKVTETDSSPRLSVEACHASAFQLLLVEVRRCGLSISPLWGNLQRGRKIERHVSILHGVSGDFLGLRAEPRNQKWKRFSKKKTVGQTVLAECQFGNRLQRDFTLFLRKVRSHFQVFFILTYLSLEPEGQFPYYMTFVKQIHYCHTLSVRCKWFFFFPRLLPTEE